MRNCVFLFIICFFAALIPNSQASGFTYSQLKILIEEKEIQSLDQLLTYLPESLRKNFVLMHKSQSVQEATPLQPRVLLFTEDGSMGLAFSTSDPNMVEILELNPKTNKMEPHVILFDEASDNKVKVVDDPLSYFPKSHPNHCTRCHSEKMHFNWDTYPRWPGAFGVNNKNLSPFSKEKSSLKELQRTIDDRSPLRHLPGSKSVSLLTLGLRNNSITNRLSETNAKRIVELLKESPQFPKYRAAIFAALLNESRFTQFLSEKDKEAFLKEYEELKADTQKRLKDYEKTLDARQKSSGFGSSFFQKIEHGQQYDHHEIERTAKMRFLADRMGISSADWGMTRIPGTYATQTGMFGLFTDMLTPYVEVLRETDPELLAGKELKASYIGGYKNRGSWRSLAKEIQTKVWKETGEVPVVTCQTFFSRFFQ